MNKKTHEIKTLNEAIAYLNGVKEKWQTFNFQHKKLYQAVSIVLDNLIKEPTQTLLHYNDTEEFCDKVIKQGYHIFCVSYGYSNKCDLVVWG